MALWSGVAGALVCSWLIAGAPDVTPFEQTQTGDAELADAVRMFDQGVARYVSLRARFSEPLPPFDERRDAWSLMLTRRYLASAIRAARSSVAQGDIFTPRVAAVFRVLVTHAVYDEDIEGMLPFDWQPRDSPVDLVANEPLPIPAMRTVPGALLARLPPLPEAIEYRLANGALILWDAHAEILIDWLPDPVLTD